MGFTLKEICEAVGGYTEGDATIIVNSVAEPGLASEIDLAFAADINFANQIKDGASKVAILSPGMNFRDYGLDGALIVDRPRFEKSLHVLQGSERVESRPYSMSSLLIQEFHDR